MLNALVMSRNKCFATLMRAAIPRRVIPMPRAFTSGARDLARISSELKSCLQRMQVREQIVHLLRGKDISKAFHLVSAQHNDIANSIIVRRHSAHAQILVLENAF
jgi:hypothetical protein